MMILSSSKSATFKVGSLVRNFGAEVEVLAEDDGLRGMLVKIAPVFRDGRRQGGAGQRYFANPEKCEIL